MTPFRLNGEAGNVSSDLHVPVCELPFSAPRRRVIPSGICRPVA
jgi:hypothetical protein